MTYIAVTVLILIFLFGKIYTKQMLVVLTIASLLLLIYPLVRHVDLATMCK